MNISDWIDRRAGFSPGKTAVRFDGTDITYAGLAGQVAVMTAVLSGRLGVVRGDRVAWLGYNHPDMLVLLFACARLGALFVPLNWRLAGAEHRVILDDCRPAAVFVEPDFIAPLVALQGELQAGMRLIATGPAPAGWLAQAELLDGVVAEPRRDFGASYADPAVICYTSGTTGAPKGAVLTQDALFHNAVNSAHMHDLTSADVVLTTLPMFHVGGLNIQTVPALHAGATVLLHAKFLGDAVFDAIEGQGVTLTVLVPTQLDVIMNSPRWAGARLGSLRSISTGSSVVAPRLIRRVLDRGIPLIQVYGSTETAPIAAYQTAADAFARPGSAGRCALHCELKIVDEMGREVVSGASGEVWVKGANVTTGYWNDPRASQRAFQDGWFRTGDVGHYDADGWLYIDDRIKDMIISGGENVYPAQLEAVLAECPDIVEAAVVGRPDARWGEAAVAVVVRRPGTQLSPAQVLELFEGRLARYKHPRDVVFVEALPRNAMGKFAKAEIRKLVTQTLEPEKA